MYVAAKHWYQSKTFWLGIAEIVLGLAVELAGEVQTALQAGQKIGWIIIAKGLLTILLRHKTDTGLTFTGQTVKPARTGREEPWTC